MTTTALIYIDNITCDTSAIESDGSRWHGRITFRFGELVAVGMWVGDNCSEDGRIFDVEGEDEAFCQRIEELADQIEREFSAVLGRPYDEDPTGLWSALEAVAQARRAA